ncbi:MAG: hypothetical protein HZC47_03935 [Methanobacterium sp.]|uniref:hypothetical protein n=1 Tax=Methanobacterium sp. TaxID=2164 RepID=UPI003D655B68|nr:hypothetical protein [Methanobacterium sp.]
MVSAKFYEKLMKISRVMEKEGEGISYIRNEKETYTIGTRKYSEKIAKFLDETVGTWEGSEANVKKRKKKGKVSGGAAKKVGYLWKIPVTD